MGSGVLTKSKKIYHFFSDVVLDKEVKVKALLEILGRRFETAHLQYAAALVEYVVSREEIQVHHAGFVGEEGAVAPVQADNAVAVAQEGLGHRGHHGIHSRSGTAASP